MSHAFPEISLYRGNDVNKNIMNRHSVYLDNGHIVDSHTEEDREKSKKSIFSGGFKEKSDQASSAPLILTAANRQKKVQQGYQHCRYLGWQRTK